MAPNRMESVEISHAPESLLHSVLVLPDGISLLLAMNSL